MERNSTSIRIKSMPIKTTIRYHFTLVTTAIIKRSTNNKDKIKRSAKNVQKMKSSHNLDGNVNDEATVETSMEFPRNTSCRGNIWSCNPTHGLRSRENHHLK